MPDAVSGWALRFTYAGLRLHENFGLSFSELNPTTGGLGLVKGT